MLVAVDSENKILKARIALGAVAPTPVRVPAAEEPLQGHVLTSEMAQGAAATAAQHCRPASDIRATAAYRREMVNNLCYRGLIAAYQQAIAAPEEVTNGAIH